MPSYLPDDRYILANLLPKKAALTSIAQNKSQFCQMAPCLLEITTRMWACKIT